MTLRELQDLRGRKAGQLTSAGFTLVELLVVMAIVAILTGLTGPALVRARGMAQGARCLGNLRQLGLAARLYWDDHGGQAFREGVTQARGGQIYWFGWLQDGAEGRREFRPEEGKLWPYIQGRGVETCPALDPTRIHFKAKARGAAFGYGYNLFLGPREVGEPGQTGPVVVDRLSEPAHAAVFVDCAQINDFQAPASPGRPLLEEFYFFETQYRTVHFRHRARANVVFVDGHVDPQVPEPGSEDPRLPGQLIGRLPRHLVIPR